MSFRHAILGLLSHGPVPGYDLKSCFVRDLVPSDRLNIGQVYTTLDRLRRDGFVGHQKIAQSERPDKKVYHLTPAGRNELREWLETPTALELDLRNETYLKLMTARRLDWASPDQVISTEKRACMTRLHEMQLARIAADHDGSPVQTRMLLELALLRLEAFAKWLDRCETLLKEERDT